MSRDLTLLLEFRPALLAFCQVMEQRLAAKENKGTWQASPLELLQHLRQNVADLEKAVKGEPGREAALAVTQEAADVANYAMMLCDRFGTTAHSTMHLKEDLARARAIFQALQILKENL